MFQPEVSWQSLIYCLCHVLFWYSEELLSCFIQELGVLHYFHLKCLIHSPFIYAFVYLSHSGDIERNPLGCLYIITSRPQDSLEFICKRVLIIASCLLLNIRDKPPSPPPVTYHHTSGRLATTTWKFIWKFTPTPIYITSDKHGTIRPHCVNITHGL